MQVEVIGLKKMTILLVLSMFLMTVTAPALAQMTDQKAGSQDKNIVQIASSADQFSTLTGAVKQADLAQTLSGKGPYTVFAPTNDAFDKLPEGTVDSLMKDKDQLKSVLTYHVVSGNMTKQDLMDKDSVKTVQGESLPVKTTDGTLMIGNAKVIGDPIMASNGIIYPIDTVLVPGK
mgnify:CR=1 FL=1